MKKMSRGYWVIYEKSVGPIVVVAFCLLSIYCNGQSYYKKIRDNIGDFARIIDHLNRNQMLELRDSISLKNDQVIKLNNRCVFIEQLADPLVKDFMKKYDLNRICYSRLNNEYFNSIITFHKNHIPFSRKAIVTTYDFGQSRLRDLANQEGKSGNEKVKIINEMFLYRLKSKPSFGE